MRVAVLLPGVMGSRLERDGKAVWPGSVLDLLRHFSDDEFEALRDPAVIATDVIRRYFLSTQYQSLIDDLERFGFREAGEPPSLYPFPYDWRQSVEHAADALADRLDGIFEGHAGDLELVLVGHSMGGLVARHYLESGSFEERPAYGVVRLLVCLGTPHRGAPEALPVALGHEGRLWLTREQAARLAADPRYPSAYQLLPHHGEPFAWSEDPGAQLTPLDIYDEPLTTLLGLVPANLAAAARLQASLRGPVAGVRYFCFSGTRQATASLVHVRKLSPTSVRVRAVEPEDSGDGTVPDWSSRLPGVQGLAVGGEHATLYRNSELRRALGTLLGATEVLAPASFPAIEVALRDRFVGPGAEVRGLLSFPPSSFLRGELRLERALSPDAAAFEPAGEPHGIQYRGLHAETLGIVFDAPARPGFYRAGFYPAGSNEPAGTDELFVLA